MIGDLYVTNYLLWLIAQLLCIIAKGNADSVNVKSLDSIRDILNAEFPAFK